MRRHLVDTYNRLVFREPTQRMRGFVLQTLMVAILLLVIAPVCSQRVCAQSDTPSKVTLDYDVAPSCPTEREFQDLVIGKAGQDPFILASNERLAVSIYLVDETYVTSISRWSKDEELAKRTLSPSLDCNEAAEIASSIVASSFLHLEPKAIETPTAPTPRKSPEKTSPKKTPKEKKPEPRKTDETMMSQWLASVGARSTLGTFPVASIGGELEIGVIFSDFVSVRIFGRVETNLSSNDVSFNDSFSETTWRKIGGGLRACLHESMFVGCGTLNIGEIRSVLDKGFDPGEASAVTADAGISVGVRIPLSESIFFGTDIEGIINIGRPRLVVDASRELWQAPVFAGGLTLKMGLRR